MTPLIPILVGILSAVLAVLCVLLLCCVYYKRKNALAIANNDTNDASNSEAIGLVLPSSIMETKDVIRPTSDIDISHQNNDLYPKHTHNSDIQNNIAPVTAITNLEEIDFGETVDVDDLLQTIVNKVCGDNRTRIIDEDDLIIGKSIGEGHFGHVYLAQFDGNQVAVKEFPSLDINKHDRYLLTKQKSEFDNNNSATNQNNNNNINSNLSNYDSMEEKLIAKKIYSRKREIYSEIAIASSLRCHSNLVQLIGFTQSPLRIVMKYYGGGTLQSFVYLELRAEMHANLNRKLSLISIMNIYKKMSYGLSFLHKNNIVHRDIAARNVLLGSIPKNGQIDEHCEIVISDFGMTRVMNSKFNDAQTKQKLGPIKWMAPESIAKRTYSKQSDVYMFGIAMWEVLNGKQPYLDNECSGLSLAVLASRIVKNGQRPKQENVKNIEANLLGNDTNNVIPKIQDLMESCWNGDIRKRPDISNVSLQLDHIYDSMRGI